MADEFLNVEVSDELKRQLQPTITQKLAQMLGVSSPDDDLFQYIMLLVSNNRSKAHVSLDLETFFGGEAKPFTDWLWKALVPYRKTEPVPVVSSSIRKIPATFSSSSGSRDVSRTTTSSVASTITRRVSVTPPQSHTSSSSATDSRKRSSGVLLHGAASKLLKGAINQSVASTSSSSSFRHSSHSRIGISSKNDVSSSSASAASAPLVVVRTVVKSSPSIR